MSRGVRLRLSESYGIKVAKSTPTVKIEFLRRSAPLQPSTALEPGIARGFEYSADPSVMLIVVSSKRSRALDGPVGAIHWMEGAA